MINFCTLFDSNYLARGLVLHESLQRTCSSYHLYVVAFDDQSFNYLKQAALPNLTPVHVSTFEDSELLKVKPTRSIAEYCWTCTSSIILYCINTYKLPSCTYLDADMVFYQDPQVLFNELGNKSVIITEHRYSRAYDLASLRGIYCVQFMYFKNDENGITALKWWRERCLEWCYAYLEDGKFGDQKYLDDWTTRFQGVHVLKNQGAGIAPWNLQQFKFSTANDHISLQPVKGGETIPLIFFHFHGVKFFTNDMVVCCGAIYEIDKGTREIVYLPYIKKLLATEDMIKEKSPAINANGRRGPAPGRLKVFLGYIKELLVYLKMGKLTALNPKNLNHSKHYHFYKTENLH